MACVTLAGHVSRAIDFFNKENVYFGIGRTTPWENELQPDEPTVNTLLTEVVGYKKVETKYLVIPDPTGEITYKDARWKIVPANEAVSLGARWVYLNCFISFSELPTNVSYRQIGVFTGLIPDSDHIGQYALLPDSVDDVGRLEIIDNRSPIYRATDMREQLSIIVEL